MKADLIAPPCPPIGQAAAVRRLAPAAWPRLHPRHLGALALASAAILMPSLALAEAPDGLKAARAGAPALAPAPAVVVPAPAVAEPAPAPAAERPAPAAEPPAAPPAGGSASAAVDPLEHLRQRLADRLAAKPLAPDSGAYDLRVSARAAPTASVANAARTPARSASGPRVPAWAYDGDDGGLAPEAWGGLCGSGQRQSPIDLHGGLPVPLEPIRFDYGAAGFAVLDTGRAVQVDVHGAGAGGEPSDAPGAAAIEVGGKRYVLQHFSVHRPSEVQIDGRRFALSLQLTHRAADGAWAVVVLVMDPGPAQPALDAVLAHLPLEKLQRNQARVPLELASLLPDDPRYFMYTGSLTTPPCTEGVLRLVMRHPLTASPAQIDVLSRLYPANVRPLQAAGGRRILQSD